MPEEIQEPQGGQPQEPVTQDPDKSGQPQGIDYEKSYKELQSKFNARDEEIKTARQIAKEKEELEKQINNLTKLTQIIESDEELFKAVEAKIKGTPAKEEPQRDDVRETITGNVVKEFEGKYGIDKLDPEKAQAIRTRIGQEIYQVSGRDIKDIPLSELAGTLEKGYTLATAEDKEEQARRQGYIEARQNREAEFGSIPSSGVNGTQKPLTPDEQKVARRLNISEDDYRKYKDK